jgi:hypothetical protein
LELLIALATSRVFARLPPGSVQAAATAEFAEPLGVLPAALAGACLAEQAGALELLPLLVLQPAAARPAAASRLTPATPVRVTRNFT